MLCAKVDNLDDLVYEDDDLLLQALGRVRELSDPAYGKHDLHFLAGERQVHSCFGLRQGFRNYLGTELAKSTLEQRPNLENGLFEHLCFHLIGVLFLVRQFWLLEGALRQLLDDCDDFLDRDDHVHLGVVGEDDEGHGKHHACEQSRRDLVCCRLP